MIKNLTLTQSLNYHNHLVQVTAALSATMGLSIDPIRAERILNAAEALVDESWRKMGYEVEKVPDWVSTPQPNHSNPRL